MAPCHTFTGCNLYSTTHCRHRNCYTSGKLQCETKKIVYKQIRGLAPVIILNMGKTAPSKINEELRFRILLFVRLNVTRTKKKTKNYTLPRKKERRITRFQVSNVQNIYCRQVFLVTDTV